MVASDAWYSKTMTSKQKMIIFSHYSIQNRSHFPCGTFPWVFRNSSNNPTPVTKRQTTESSRKLSRRLNRLERGRTLMLDLTWLGCTHSIEDCLSRARTSSINWTVGAYQTEWSDTNGATTEKAGWRSTVEPRPRIRRLGVSLRVCCEVVKKRNTN